MEDRAHVLAAAHVLATVRAVDAGRGGDFGLTLRALDPLLGRLVAAHGRLCELLPVVAQMLDEPHRRVEERVRLALLAKHDGGETFQVAVPLLDDVEFLEAQAQPVLLHLVEALELLPVGDLEGQAHRRAAQLAGEKGGADLADELDRLLGLDDVVGAVDDFLFLEDLAEQLRSSGGLQGGHLGGRGRAGTDADAEPSGLDLFARNLRVPER